MARLKEIDDEPITQFGSQVDRMLAHHILALERAHNEREDPAEPVDAARCKCGHLSANHHTPKIAGMNNVLKFGCIQCGCSDFRSAEQEHREQNPHAEPEKILPSAEEEWEQITTRHGDKDLRVTLLRECLPYLEGEMILPTRMQNFAISSGGYGRGSGRRSDEGSMVEMVTCGILVWGSMCYVHPYGRTEWTLTRETVIIDLPELL